MKPLTINELKEDFKVGDWVWFVHNQVQPCYGKIMDKHNDTIYFSTTEGLQRVHWINYGITWFAYKNKEQAETKGEWVEQPCKIGDTVYFVHSKDQVKPIEFVIADISAKTRDGKLCWFVWDQNTYGGLYGDHTVKDFIWFIGTDKSEAEARLKELRGEK